MNQNFGIKLRKLRKSHHVSMRDASIRGGIARSQISRIEHSHVKDLHWSTLKKLAKGINVPESDIFKIAGVYKPSKKVNFDKVFNNGEYFTYHNKPLSKRDIEIIKDDLNRIYNFNEIKGGSDEIQG